MVRILDDKLYIFIEILRLFNVRTDDLTNDNIMKKDNITYTCA